MAIVLEGPDNSGKSTLAKELSELTGWPIIHSGGPGDEEDILVRLEADLRLMEQDVILDRSVIISDTIYSKRLRGQRLFDPRPYVRTMRDMDEYNSRFMLIFCTAPDEVLADMSTHIVKPHETKEHVDAVLQNKHALMLDYVDMYNCLSMFIDCPRIDPRAQPEIAKAIVAEMDIAKEEEDVKH